MLQGFSCRYSLTRIKLQKGLDQRQTLLAYFPKIFLIEPIEGLDFRETHPQEPLILDEPLMQIGRESAKCFLDEEQLVKLVFPRKQRISIDEFTHDAGDCPQINLPVVVSSDEQFRGTIPTSSHIVSDLLVFFSELSRKTEIAYFESIVRTDKKVFRFDVPMDNIQSMEIGESLQQLEDQLTDQRQLQSSLRFLQHLQQIILNILEHQVHDSLLSKRLLHSHDVRVACQLQNLHFPHCSFPSMLLFISVLELFDGYELPLLNVIAFQYHAISTLPNSTQNLVFLHSVTQGLQSVEQFYFRALRLTNHKMECCGCGCVCGYNAIMKLD